MEPSQPQTPTPGAEFPLLAYADKLVEELRGHIPQAVTAWDEEGIHQARVATRRLKAALDLMRPVLSKRHRRPFARLLRRLRRRLGPLRDADVMIGHLQVLHRSARRQKGAVEWLSRRLCREREALREASGKKGSSATVLAKLASWWPVRQEMAEAREAVDSLLAQSLHLQTDAFAEQADRLVAGMRAPAAAAAGDTAMPDAAAAGETKPAHDPHELRIAGKALRYTLEMAAAEGHPLPKSVLKLFKRMQEALGLWHDFVVLADRALEASLQIRLGHFDAPLQEQVLEVSKRALRRAARQLDEFAKVWSERGEELAAAVRASFPLTQPAAAATTEGQVSEPQTGPGPRGSGGTSAPEGCPPAAASTA